jgi:hypothetical protein
MTAIAVDQDVMARVDDLLRQMTQRAFLSSAAVSG